MLLTATARPIDDVATRYPAWFADVTRAYGDQDVICLDLWVQQGDGERFMQLENDTDEDLADAAGPEAVARMRALAAGPLDAWLDQDALVLGSCSTASRRAHELVTGCHRHRVTPEPNRAARQS